jgi:hypothetical protein
LFPKRRKMKKVKITVLGGSGVSTPELVIPFGKEPRIFRK